jgi:signal transduction histidine kinase
MGSVNRRVGLGFAVLLLLFLAVVTVQLIVGERLQNERQSTADRLDEVRAANESVLQNMTDAETGVRGFQLTGRKDFLDPYDTGRVGAFTAFDTAEAGTRSATVRRLLYAERGAASHWLYAYAVPIVLGGVADDTRADRGKQMFDAVRKSNAAVTRAVAAERRAAFARAQRTYRLAQLGFAGLDVLFIAFALLLFAIGRRQLLAPLEHIRLTLQRLAAGDRSARAVPRGPGEMRVVIGTLNHLAAQTERLLDAEQARSLRNELRQAVAAELQGGLDASLTASRIAALLGATLRADAVHAEVTVSPGRTVKVCWPPEAPSLSGRTVHDVLAGRPGAVMTVPHTSGAVAIPLAGDADCPPGLIYLVRRDEPVWRPEERMLLATLGREIYHAVRQQRLHHQQSRLIGDLRVLDERKDAFVATVTHELRTPLTSILGYTEMLSDGDGGELSALQQRGVAAILRNALRLQETVGDLLLLDRGTGRQGAVYLPVDLAAVASSVAAEVEPAAEAKSLVLTVDCAGPAWVSGDEGQLRRAVHNLLDNAIKFTTAGGRIGCRIAVRDGTAEITVTDTGIGIPADDLAGLGSGLGLAIVHNIMAEHGGTIEAESQLDAGSTFTMTLPVVQAPAEVLTA